VSALLVEYYASKDNCFGEIRLARKVFGNTAATLEQYQGIERALAFMYLHCPAEIQDLVLSTLEEAEKRKPLAFILAGN